MKAMVLNAPMDLVLEQVERPSGLADDCIVRVTHSGVCGTDLKIFQGGIHVKHPLIMGHEMIGELIEGGDGKKILPGSRVIVDPVVFCGRCFHCSVGQNHLCPNGTLLGRDRNGGFAEYVKVPSGNVYLLPDSVADSVAPLIQVLTTCLHAQRLAQIFPGDAVAVHGLGVSGQLHVQLAKARGAYPVIGITRSAWKRELAEQLGADLTLPYDETTKDHILDITDGRGVDLVVESVGQIPVLATAIDIARIGGRLLLFGIYTASEGSLPFYQLYFKELAIINARAAKSEDYPSSIDLVQRGVVRLEPLVSHTFSLVDLEQALRLLTAKDVQRMKIILEHTI